VPTVGGQGRKRQGAHYERDRQQQLAERFVTPRRLIPERTVDSMFAIEIAQFVPHALVWSPTNTKGEVDHVVHGLDALALSFECKGTVTDAAQNPAKPWKSPIDYPQLTAYVGNRLPVLYVVPAKPTNPDSPWIRTCNHDPDRRGRCRACRNPRWGLTSRRWAGKSPTVKGAQIHCRFQPWFAHWCWVIPAGVLDRNLARKGSPREMPTADHQLATIRGADRLCHFLTDVHDGKRDLTDIALDPSVLAERLRELPPRQDPPRERSDDESEEADSTWLQFVFIPNLL